MREQLGRAPLEGSCAGGLRKDLLAAGRGLMRPADRPRPPLALPSAADGGAGSEVPPPRGSFAPPPCGRIPPGCSARRPRSTHEAKDEGPSEFERQAPAL